MQSSLDGKIHLGIIMDGNGRWATARGLPRSEGHKAGANAIRPIIEAAAETGIGTVTLYAFSGDNWRRPKREVSGLMALLRSFLQKEIKQLQKAGVRVSLIGRRDRLAPGLRDRIARAEARTANGRRLHLRIAFDYSARDAIFAAARGHSATCRDEFSRLVAGDVPDVDLVIRTGGDKRLSDFLLWESAYAELLFLERAWPDFGPADLKAALAEFAERRRRLGGLDRAAAAA
jgi:undecaprenyl diphosphate synthase